MKQLRNHVIRAGLGALYFTGAHFLLRPIFAGVGAIFMLHHVRPRRDAAFQPNHHLEVAPEFLRAMLSHLKSRDIDIAIAGASGWSNATFRGGLPASPRRRLSRQSGFRAAGDA
jgi:hypothetical protein